MNSAFRQFRLLRYAWPHWRDLAFNLLMILAGIGLSLIQPWPMKLLVDQVLGQNPIPSSISEILSHFPGPTGVHGLLLWICVSTVAIFIVGSLVSAISSTISLRYSQRMTYDLAADLFLHIQKLSLTFHSTRSVGDLMSRVTSDSYCIQTLVNGAILPVLQSSVTLVMMFVIMWGLEPTITLLSLAVTPFLILSIRLFGKTMKTRGKERRELEVQMTSLVQQSLSALPAVQAFTREELEHDRFRKFAKQTVDAYVRSSMSQTFFKLFVGLVTSIGTASIMYLGAIYVMDGRITVGTILVFLSYLRSLYDPLNALTHVASTLQTLTASSDRVLEILDTPQAVSDSPTAKDVVLRGTVQFDDVSFGYMPERQILRDISFNAKPGETIAIVGPTGAGKTTIVSMLVRFHDPWSGSVRVDGRDIRELRIRTLRKQIAMVLQDPFIFPSTIADNIAFGKLEASRDQIIAAAQAANAHEFIVRLPNGYDTVVGERGATLSGGEKQRLSTARAFLIDAPILILDEPSSSLDAKSEMLLLEALDRLMKGRTTFIIAHRFSTIRNANKILMVNNGQIVESGTHEELMALDKLYAQFYSLQFARSHGQDETNATLLKEETR